MWGLFCTHTVLLFFTQIYSALCQEKGSLTFVIDTTLSMRDDINQVKRSADKITEAVFQEKGSQIQNMVLVTFNDPHANLEAIIEDRGTFKSKINSVQVHNMYQNWDCPEMSMKGLLLALENSLPGSFIYVFTDASAKDYRKSAEIKNMCQKKQSQIIFVLTGHCYGLRDPAFKVYSEIASACSGIAFYVGKSDVDKVIDTVTETIKGKQAPLAVRKVPPRQYIEIPFDIDEETEYAIVTVSGVDVFLSVHGPGGRQERGMWIRNAKVIKLYTPTPGIYYAKVRGSTETSVYIVGRTDFTFTHGFSEDIPDAMSDTGLQPIAKENIYLSIAVNDPKGTVHIESAQILDTDEKVMKTFPLTRMPNGFYLTTPFVVPIHPFKIAVYGRSVHTGKYIQRIGKIVVTPTKKIEPVITNRKPVVEISEGSSLEVEYGKPLKLTCKVSAYPKPEITWTNSHKTTVTSESAEVKLPYEYISYLSLSEVTDSDKFSCNAVNSVSSDPTSQTISIVVKDPFHVNSDNTIQGTKEVQYGDRTTLHCDIRSTVPMQITWSFVQESTGMNIPIVASDNYSISPDGTTLDINKMDLDMVGTYSCKASLIADPKTNRVFSATVTVGGLTEPKVTGVAMQNIRKGSSVVIKCEVTGIPKPTIAWQFMAIGHSTYVLIPGFDNLLTIANVEEKDAGRYKCIASNALGKDEHVITLNVQIPSRIISSPGSSLEYKAVEDKDRVVKIPCAATGLPKPVITWTVNGVPISPSSKYSIDDGGLVIHDPKVSDSQSYRCEATNDAGTTELVFTVDILQKPQIMGVKAKTILKGKVGTIECKVVKGVPKPTMSWYFMANGRSEYELIRGSEKVLRMPSVAENDAGRYKCVARNDIGTDQHETTLTVNVPSTILPSSSSEYKAVEDRDRVLKIPCKATGVPKPVITWRVNGVVISTSSKYSIDDGGLVIHDPKVSDSQSYRCEATNDAGTTELVFRANILQKPQVMGVKAKTILKGKAGTIECNIIKGVPKPSITWQYSPNLHSKFVVIPGSDQVLQIPSVDENDAGHYKCVARNDAGYDEHITTLVVQSPAHLPPSASVVYKAVEGRDAVLKIPCEASGNPKPTITWEVNGVTISPNAKYSIKDGTLVIKEPKVSDSQSYRCEAKNDAGTADRTFQAVINQRPQVTGSPVKAVVKGNAVAIDCKIVKGVPAPSISWQYKANDYTNYVPLSETGNVLRIASVIENDAGSYKCIARNEAGEDEHVTSLTVQTLPKIETSSPTEYLGVESKDTMLKIPCVATGLPKPDIAWKVGGVTILSGPKYSIEDVALVIKDPKVSDSQSYRCEAKNDAGTADRTFQAIIRQLPKVTGEKIKRVAEGKSVTINCNIIKGVPRPKITWHFKATTRSEYISLSGTDDAMGIKNVSKTDTGLYKCIANNAVGEDEHVTTLIVEFPPTILPTPSKTYTSVEGDIVLRIPCAASGVPRPDITWQMDGTAITSNAHYTVTEQALIIRDPKKSDTKSYKCIAKNHLGTVDTTFEAKVYAQLIDYGKIEEINMVKGTSKMLECYSEPSQSVRWYKDGNDLRQKGKYLNLQNVDESYDGKYSCRASDMRGVYTHTYKVTVGYKPTFTHTHKPVIDWAGEENVYLDCEYKAKPAANVVWTLNDKVLSDQKSPRLVLSGNWGRYSCKVTNIHGTEQRNFDVKSTECIIAKKAMNNPTMPLILNTEASWPTLDVTKDYVKIKSGETVIMSCTDKNQFRTLPSISNITATCDKQDTFTVDGETYKITDLQCDHEIKSLVTAKHEQCLNENSELVRVSFEVDCFLEAYEVCFDISKNLPLYTRVAMSKSNRGPEVTHSWHTETGVGSQSDDSVYTCKDASSTCCYSKHQLVNAREFNDGPPQRSTFIDPLNAIPLWHPCDADQSPWSDIESMTRSKLDTFEQFVTWTGTHMLETKDGHVIPRYLWKVLNFDDEDSNIMAVVYINGQSPSDKDILCENKCANAPWIRKNSKHVYCCDIDDFLRVFELGDTTVGQSLPEAYERINARCPRTAAIES